MSRDDRSRLVVTGTRSWTMGAQRPFPGAADEAGPPRLVRVRGIPGLRPSKSLL